MLNLVHLEPESIMITTKKAPLKIREALIFIMLVSYFITITVPDMVS